MKYKIGDKINGVEILDKYSDNSYSVLIDGVTKDVKLERELDLIEGCVTTNGKHFVYTERYEAQNKMKEDRNNFRRMMNKLNDLYVTKNVVKGISLTKQDILDEINSYDYENKSNN